MAPLNIMRNFAPAMAVGVLSAAANVVEKQAKENPENGNGNAFFQNASLWGDIVIGGYSVFNYSQNQGSRLYPQSENESLAMAGAGMALLTRRASDWIGATFLKLPTGSRYTPSRSMQRGRPSLRPASAIETGILPRKRQFFSVT